MAIEQYERLYPDEKLVIEKFRDFLVREPQCFERSTVEGHITGSAWVVDDRRTHVLLTHHRKLNKWLQLGGHADGESDVIKVALTEAREESGIDEILPLFPFIFDLDVHVIPERKSEPEHLHYDVRYVVLSAHTNHVVGEESHDLAWVPISQLHDYTTEASMLRMAHKWNALNEQSQ